jgi:hypothetical protein
LQIANYVIAITIAKSHQGSDGGIDLKWVSTFQWSCHANGACKFKTSFIFVINSANEGKLCVNVIDFENFNFNRLNFPGIYFQF